MIPAADLREHTTSGKTVVAVGAYEAIFDILEVGQSQATYPTVRIR